MDIAELDALLARYREAERRAGVALVDLDANPSWRMLSAGTVRGETARRVGEAVATAPRMWADYERLRTTLASAEQVRGTGRRVDDAVRAELERMLTGPSVAADTPATAPDPSLFGAAPTTSITIDQLLDRMTAAYGAVTAAVAEVDAAWARAVPRLDAARTALGPLRTRAAAIDITAEPALDTLADLVAGVERTLGDDPLAVTDARLTPLAAALDVATGRIAALEAAHASLEADLARAHTIRRTLVETLNAVRESYAAVVERITDPAGAADLSTGDLEAFRGVRDDAVGILDQAATAGEHWRTRRVRLDAWLARAGALDARLRAAVEANEAPVRRRDELRGLVAALEAKAAGRRRIEHPDTIERLRAARDELGRAPCDLDRAASLVESLARELSTKDAT